MIKQLQGKKTYILAGCGGLITVAYMIGWINYEIWEVLVGLCGFGGLATMAAKINRNIE